MSRDRRIVKFAREHNLSYQQAKQQYSGAATAGTPQAVSQYALGSQAVDAWETQLPAARVPALRRIAQAEFGRQAAALRRGALRTFDQACLHAGVIQSVDVTVADDYAQRAAEDLEDARGSVPHDETSLVRTFTVTPRWVIAHNLYDALTANGDDLLTLLMTASVPCSEGPQALTSAGTTPEVGRVLLDRLEDAPAPASPEQALALVRRTAKAHFPVAAPSTTLGRIGRVDRKTALHAYHRILERADLAPDRRTVGERWVEAIPLINDAAEPGATRFDHELAQRAVWDLGAAALRDIRRLAREHADLAFRAPRLSSWPKQLLDATEDVSMGWFVVGATPSRIARAWTPVVHTEINAARRVQASASEKTIALYRVARLCAELHAAQVTAGINY
jgi:hypothetical protein